MPARSTIFGWLEEHEEFARRYTLARQIRVLGRHSRRQDRCGCARSACASLCRPPPASSAAWARRTSFEEITPGAYGRRSHHVSKAYGRYRKLVGVKERGQDFHALRHTFTNMMEGAGVAVPTIQLLIGHSRKQTMGTTAIYSQGDRVNLRNVINRLRYPPRVMRLMRAA
jgi:integrase